jgi:Ethanolamine utilization protein EutJ (predicted chaperonin)
MKTAAYIFILLIGAAIFSEIMAISLVHAEECYSPDQNKSGFAAAFQNSRETDLSQQDALNFMKAIVADHPDWPAKALDVDSGHVFEAEGLPNIGISIIKDGCVSFTITVPRADFQKYKTEALGTGI